MFQIKILTVAIYAKPVHEKMGNLSPILVQLKQDTLILQQKKPTYVIEQTNVIDVLMVRVV